jgi:large repetitive protein
MCKQTQAFFLLVVVALFPPLMAAQSAGNWAYTAGSLNTARDAHTATLLSNGELLIVGGEGSSGILSTAELYNPTNELFTYTDGGLNAARYGHTATLLNNGQVLIVGGYGSSGALSTAELYNPSSGAFTYAEGGLNVARYDHAATLLSNGMVLITGGENSGGALASAELYNPATGTFTLAANSMNYARYGHTSTLLNTGMVLIADSQVILGSAVGELYNPTTGVFTVTGTMVYTHTGQPSNLLNNGMVLFAGGGLYGTTNAELYNPATGKFTATTGPLQQARGGNTATLLSNGEVLIAGGGYTAVSGLTKVYRTLASVEIYNPQTSTFAATGSLNFQRSGHTATLLANGEVLAVGGVNFISDYLATAELYEPTSFTPSGLTSISLSPANPDLAIGSSQIFIATGDFSGTGNETLASVTWTSSNTSIATISNDPTNSGHADALSAGTTTIKACAGSICGSTTLTVLPHESVILGDRYTSPNNSSTWEIYDDSGTRLNYGDALVNPLANHTAVRLNNGNIFVAGGAFNTTLWQIFSIASGQPVLVSSGTLQQGRDSSFGTLLPNGNVFIGGGGVSGGASSWEIWTATGTPVAQGSLSGVRTAGASVVVLQNGNLWISGSYFENGDACTWEIRNQSGVLVTSGMYKYSCFGGAKVQVLGNGNVFVVGGGNQVSEYEIWSPTGTFIRNGSLTYGSFNNGATSVSLDGGNQMMILGSCGLTVTEDNFGTSDPVEAIGCAVGGGESSWDFIGFDSNSNITFETPGSLVSQRNGARATVTASGSVFIVGGSFDPGGWEIWAPSGTTMLPVSNGTLFFTHYSGSMTHY